LVCRRDDTEDTEDGGALAFSVSSASSVSKWQKKKRGKAEKGKKKESPLAIGSSQKVRDSSLSLSLSAADPYHQQDQQGKAAGARRRGTRPLE
jgi:hypothetical protein